jgi:hypothetical protein
MRTGHERGKSEEVILLKKRSKRTGEKALVGELAEWFSGRMSSGGVTGDVVQNFC